MFNTNKLLALGTAVALMGLSTAAFAGPDIGPTNEQQYQVSAQESLNPVAPKLSAASMHQSGIGSLIGPADPHSGPAFDPDVE